jgi:hypothetical protein
MPISGRTASEFITTKNIITCEFSGTMNRKTSVVEYLISLVKLQGDCVA